MIDAGGIPMPPVFRTRCRAASLFMPAAFALAAPASASIAPSQLVVVYNSASSEAVTLKNSYLAEHPTIPALNVIDLNNAALLTSDLTYAQFVASVRNPIRTYLQTPGAGRPTPT